MPETHDNPKQRYGDLKVPLQIVSPYMIAYIAQGLKEGTIKYDVFNYRISKVEAMTYVGAIKRHLDDWVEGIDVDPDSIISKPTLSGCAASLNILIDAIETGQLIDNRPPPAKGNYFKLLQRFSHDVKRYYKNKSAETKDEEEYTDPRLQ